MSRSPPPPAEAVGAVVGSHRPQAMLMTAFLLVGGIISALADLIYLGNAEFWRIAGWNGHPAPVGMVVVGRASQAIDNLTTWPEAAGLLILAAGLLSLGWLARTTEELPARLGLLAYLEGLLLVGIAISGVTHADTAYQILSLLTGMAIGPAVVLWLSWHFGRLGRRPTSSGALTE